MAPEGNQEEFRSYFIFNLQAVLDNFVVWFSNNTAHSLEDTRELS